MTSPKVSLLITCLADWVRPRLVKATVNCLSAYGCVVEVPESQTCCGQPSFNSGDRMGAKASARQMINTLSSADYVVIPSGSCTGMITKHYPELFADEPTTLLAINALQAKTYEFTQFMEKVLGVSANKTLPTNTTAFIPLENNERVQLPLDAVVTYHDSCSGLRELSIKSEPRALIHALGGKLTPMEGEEDCCGFGGAFSAKYGEISSAIAKRKCESVLATGANAVVLGDLGCMLNIEGKLRADGHSLPVLHIAEYLWWLLSKPA